MGAMAMSSMDTPHGDCPKCDDNLPGEPVGPCLHVALCLVFAAAQDSEFLVTTELTGVVMSALDPWNGVSLARQAELQPPRISAGFA